MEPVPKCRLLLGVMGKKLRENLQNNPGSSLETLPQELMWDGASFQRGANGGLPKDGICEGTRIIVSRSNR